MEVRAWENADGTAIASLLLKGMGSASVPRTAEYWLWKHHLNPYGRSPCLVALEDEEIIAVRAFMRWEWQDRRQTYRALRAVDTVVAPSARGRGLFSRLTRQLVDEMNDDKVAFIFNTPNRLSRPGYLKMGWRDLGRVTPILKLCRPLSLAHLARAPQDQMKKTPNHNGGSVDRLIGERGFEDLLAVALTDETRLHTNRSAEYLRWRYGAVPGVPYAAEAVHESGRGCVVVFSQRRTRKLSELRICELIVSPDEWGRRVAIQLVKDVISRYQPEIVSAVAAKASPEREVLRRCGLIPCPLVGLRLTGRTVGSDAVIAPPAIAGWRLTAGDIELF